MITITAILNHCDRFENEQIDLESAIRIFEETQLGGSLTGLEIRENGKLVTAKGKYK